MESGYICINCQHRADSLYKTFAGSIIRLTQCANCKDVVDKYVEYDIVLIVIDLILQYIGAYRHLLINTKYKPFHKLATLFVLCDAYDKWIFRRAQSGSEKVFDLEWTFYQCLLQSTIEMTAFTLLVLALMPNSMRKGSLRLVVTSICVGFYAIFPERSVTLNIASVAFALGVSKLIGYGFNSFFV